MNNDIINTETVERWADISGYKYSFRAAGKIYSRPMYRISSFGRIVSDYGQGYKEMTPQVSNYGQKMVMLAGKDPSGKSTTEMIGLLVARAFVPNPHNYTHITFKDGDPLNCRADNIEWVELTDKQRNQYKSMRKKINIYSLDGKYLETFESVADIRTIIVKGKFVSVNSASIYNACKKHLKYNSHLWRYDEEVKAGEDIEAWRGKSKPLICQLDKETKTVIQVFEDIEDVAISLNKPLANICANIRNCCMGKRPTAYGYAWCYQDNNC